MTIVSSPPPLVKIQNIMRNALLFFAIDCTESEAEVAEGGLGVLQGSKKLTGRTGSQETAKKHSSFP